VSTLEVKNIAVAFCKAAKIAENLISCTKITAVLSLQLRSPLEESVMKISNFAQLFSAALLCLGVTFNAQAQAQAQAQPTVRPEVAKSLQAAQDALKAGQVENALVLSQQTLAMPGITAVEKPIIQRTLAVAALQAKNFKLATSTLENLIQEMPAETPAAQKRPLIESLLNASQQAQDYTRVVDWARVYLKMEGSNPSVRPVLIQTLSVMKRHDEVIQEVKEKIRLDEAAKVKTSESDLRLMAVSQRQLKDDAGYNSTLKMLLQNYPSKAYWAEMIPRLARQANFNARFDLDLYRLLELTGNLEDAIEYIDMANLALKAGLPAEASRMVEQAYSAGLLGSQSPKITPTNSTAFDGRRQSLASP
jgi:hypothetical protein